MKIAICAIMGQVMCMSVGRQFQIVYTLLNEKTVSAPVLAKRLEVSVRTIYRDVEVLSAAGVPIFAIPGKGGGIALMEGFTLNRSLLSDEEKSQLLLALKSVSAVDTGANAELLSKLGALTGDDGDWLSVDFSRWGNHEQDSEKFDLIKRAVMKRRMLEFDYASSTGDLVHRAVRPMRVMYRAQAWYLLAYCTLRADWRLFKLHRMQRVVALDQPCGECPPPPDDISMTAIPLSTIKMLFSPRLAYRVYDEFNEDCVERLDDGTLCVTARMPADQWLLSYVLSFGAGVELLEPAWMRTMLAEVGKNVFELYSKP